MKIQTGRGTIPLITLIAIWSISALTSLPGLAVSPILGDLTKIFPKATDLDIQMLTSLPSLGTGDIGQNRQCPATGRRHPCHLWGDRQWNLIAKRQPVLSEQ